MLCCWLAYYRWNNFYKHFSSYTGNLFVDIAWPILSVCVCMCVNNSNDHQIVQGRYYPCLPVSVGVTISALQVVMATYGSALHVFGDQC